MLSRGRLAFEFLCSEASFRPLQLLVELWWHWEAFSGFVVLVFRTFRDRRRVYSRVSVYSWVGRERGWIGRLRFLKVLVFLCGPEQFLPAIKFPCYCYSWWPSKDLLLGKYWGWGIRLVVPAKSSIVIVSFFANRCGEKPYRTRMPF